MAGDSKKRRGTDETIAEAEERISDGLMIAKDNKKALKSEAKRAKAIHKTLLRGYNNGENASLKTEVEKSQADIDQMEKDLSEVEAELSSLKQEQKGLGGGMDVDDGDNQSDDGQDKRDDIADDLMIARDNLNTLRAETKKSRAKYNTLLHDYNGGEKANLKEDVEKARREVNQMDADILEAKTELNRLKVDLRENGGVPVDEPGDEHGIEEALFVPEVKTPGEDNPLISITGTGGVIEPSIEDDPEDLWSPEIARKKAGLAPDKFRVEGWKGGRARTIIAGRGPENASSFRFERESAAGVVVDLNKGDITLGRFGELKDNKKYVYGKQNYPIIQGVAWFTGGIEDPLSLLIPVPRPKPTATGEVATKVPRVEMAIKLKWIIDGLKKKSWETRSTIRRLWGYETGDKYIYEAAQEQERRHEEWKKGERQSMARSPTPGVAPRMLSPDPKVVDPKVVDLTLQLPTRPAASKPIGEKKIKQEPTEPTGKSPMLQYKEEWCEMKDIEIGDMEEQEERDFLRAWRLEKAS